jgi:sporulation protein YlmC with PRC-barrel domain
MNAHTDHPIRTVATDPALLLSSGTLKNTKVVNPAGEDLGKLEEIMLHVDSGDVAYAVVSFGGFLGMGEKLFAVPWEALRIDTAEHHIVLDVDRERLETAPGFSKDAWPTTVDAGWMKDVYRHYGATYVPRAIAPRDRPAEEPLAASGKR